MEKIKELRDKTGAGIADCKKALDESGGDIEKAIEILRKKGIAKAAKRSERETSEGVIKAETNPEGTEGYMVEVNAETDFVSRNDKFQTFGDKVLALVKENKVNNIEELLKLPLDGTTVKEELDNFSGVIGEKLDIKRCAVLTSAGSVGAYIHSNGRIGVLVALDKTGKQDLARDIAMQIAAVNPKYIYPEEVPAEEIAKEKDVYREQLLAEGKPENMLEKIMEGKINKYFEEVCLVKQEFIKDDKKKVEAVLDGAKVESFIKFSL